MARKVTSADLDALFVDIPPHRRARFIRDAFGLASKAIRRASSDNSMSPKDQAATVNQALQAAERIAGMNAKARGDEEAAVRLLEAIMRTKGQRQHTEAPEGCPGHVAAVWVAFQDGDAAARQIVEAWIDGSDSRSANSQGDSQGGASEAEGTSKPS